MKNKTSEKARGGNVRITERYKHDNWNVAKVGAAGEGMTVGEVCVVHKASGQSVIFISRAATPEFVSDQTAQAVLENCSTRIVLTPESTTTSALNEGFSHD